VERGRGKRLQRTHEYVDAIDGADAMSDWYLSRWPTDAQAPYFPEVTPATNANQGPSLSSYTPTLSQYIRNLLINPQSSPIATQIVDQVLGTGAQIRQQPSAKDINVFNLSGVPDVSVGQTPTSDQILAAAMPMVLKGITAYHGSPHDFDKFSTSAIGTGEGAQAYGHGLYFAENEGVARDYQNKLAPLPQVSSNEEMQAAKSLRQSGGDRDVAIDDLLYQAHRLAGIEGPEAKNLADSYRKSADLLKGGWEAPPTGRMYQVSINADPEHFLDWDKPLSEQSQHVQDSLADIIRLNKVPRKNNVGEETTGGQLMNYLEQYYKNKSDPSADLKDFGIPGIKYLDQGSRAGGEGTHNYVVFDDSLISILKKYGLVGLLGPAAARYLPAPGQQQ